jgi:hypothetical protein
MRMVYLHKGVGTAILQRREELRSSEAKKFMQNFRLDMRNGSCFASCRLEAKPAHPNSDLAFQRA